MIFLDTSLFDNEFDIVSPFKSVGQSWFGIKINISELTMEEYINKLDKILQIIENNSRFVNANSV